MEARVLVAEDNEDLLELISRQLQWFGYEVIPARNGIEAVRMALSRQPDLILMDLLMPKLDGRGAVAQIRKHPETRRIPVLAATAWVSATSHRDYLASGFNDYIAKPFTHVTLHAAIARLLEQARKPPACDPRQAACDNT